MSKDIDMTEASQPSRSLATRCPLKDERAVWTTLWRLLGGSQSEMRLRPIRDGAADVVAACEAHRQALIKVGVPNVH